LLANSTGFQSERPLEGASVLAAALIGGSDERLDVDPENFRNRYGCQSYPRPDEISFASSTASTISQHAFDAASGMFDRLPPIDDRSEAKHAQAWQALAEQIKRDVKRLLEVDARSEIVLSPSGTDAALLAFALAGRMRSRPVASVVAAADESGSGVALAASGCHFGATTPSGRRATKGEPIPGVASTAAAVRVKSRDATGHPRPWPEVDDEVRGSVASLIERGFDVVLYAMDHSKTGLRYPSSECLQQLTATHGDAITIVIDACQARLSRGRLKECLVQGHMVLLTGSKFFSGPPLSGALLFPASVAERIQTIEQGAWGLTDYASRYDWPASCAAIRSALPARLNRGQLLRWTAAVAEMQRYFAVPELYRTIALRETAAVIARAIRQYPNLEMLPVESCPAAGHDHDEFATPTIYSFVVKRNRKPLSMEQARALYHALNEDVAKLLRVSGTDAELAATPCHIGQPVALSSGTDGPVGALRVSVDARMIAEQWADRESSAGGTQPRRTTKRIKTVLDKIQLLTDNLDRIERHFGAPA
jgi:hypothetical protein